MLNTILILDLRGPSEDTVGHFHSPGGSKVGAIHFALFAEAGQDLAGLHGVPPDIIAMSAEENIGLRDLGWATPGDSWFLPVL